MPSLVSALPPELMDNPGYDVETAPDYDTTLLLPDLAAEAGQTLLTETAQDFTLAGPATRSVLKMVGAQAALQP